MSAPHTLPASSSQEPRNSGRPWGEFVRRVAVAATCFLLGASLSVGHLVGTVLVVWCALVAVVAIEVLTGASWRGQSRVAVMGLALGLIVLTPVLGWPSGVVWVCVGAGAGLAIGGVAPSGLAVRLRWLCVASCAVGTVLAWVSLLLPGHGGAALGGALLGIGVGVAARAVSPR